MNKLLAIFACVGVLAVCLADMVRADTDLALGGIATQSSTTAWWGQGPAVAGRAIDGNTDGNFADGSVTHTDDELAWWQVDLGKNDHIDGITIWNRTDCCSDRLSNFYITVLDKNNHTVWTKTYASFVQTTTNGTPGTVSSGMTVDLSQFNISGETVKIGLNGANWLHLAEVQVYGNASPVPIPGAVWLLGSGLAGLIGLRRKYFG